MPMLLRINSGNRKILWMLLRIGIAAVSLWFIYGKIADRTGPESLRSVLRFLIHFPDNYLELLMVLLLMPLNWSLESFKWKKLLQPVCAISFAKAIRSVLSGTTIGLFTPNRIGEFAGRVMHLEPQYRIQGTIANIIGSLSQLLITILLGSIALFISISTSESAFAGSGMLMRLASLALPIVALLIYFKIPVIVRLLKRDDWNKYTDMLLNYRSGFMLRIALLSLIRYAVFAVQFLITLHLFGIEIPAVQGLRIIAIIYLIMAVVPTIALSEITVRGSVALYLLTPFTGDAVAVLSASTFIWILNLALPASFGAFSALWIRFTK
ncbi:MAG TPA: lysylphosphatidylglycerol synthase domain-containing protein [Bacteroidia bacterium]|nr:lysylphosphatidylglycerol synthase domain-containing protein [Bacteroidia bacterium]